MALDRRVRTGFKTSEDIVKSIPNVEPSLRIEAKARARAELDETVELFKRGWNQMNVPRHGSAEALKFRELIVLAAETALANDHYELAREQARDFFLLDPPRDQFCARALFVQAHCDAALVDEQSRLGSSAVRQRLRACRTVLNALEIAENVPGSRYDFLAYNASVHCWRVLRPLLRSGAARFAVPPLQRVSEALEKANDKDIAWRVVLLIALARAQDDGSAPADAAKSLSVALDHCASLMETATKSEADAVRELEVCDANLAWAQRVQRCAVELKPLGPRPLDAASPPPEPVPEAAPKGKGKKAPEPAAPPPDAAEVEEEAVVPDAAAAAQGLLEAEQARAAALVALDKARVHLGIEQRRQEGCLLQAVHVGWDPAAASLRTAASTQLQASGPRGVCVLAAQRVRSGIVSAASLGPDACAEIESALGALEAPPAAEAAAAAGKAGASAGQQLESGLVEVVAELGLAALALLDPSAPIVDESGRGEVLSAATTTDPATAFALSTRVDVLAARCFRLAATAKDTPPTASVKQDFLKCHLMVREFEQRDAVMSAELWGAASKKASGAQLATQAMQLSASGPPPRRKGEAREPRRSALEHLAEHAMVLAAEPLVDKLSRPKVVALQLKQRVEALKVLERALLQCQRLDDASSANAKQMQAAWQKQQALNLQERGIFPDLSEAAPGDDLFGPTTVPLATEGCCLVWALAKPLLQTQLRKHAHRALELAANYLATCDSPLQSLRSQLHYEVARCEIASDFLSKAAEHVALAKRADYGTLVAGEVQPPSLTADLLSELVSELATTAQVALSVNDSNDGHEELKDIPTADQQKGMLNDVAEAKAGGLLKAGALPTPVDVLQMTPEALADHVQRRKLDASVLPLDLTLTLKKAIYEDPEGCEERALLVLEQAKEATNPALQSMLLGQAAALLIEGQEVEEAAAATGGGSVGGGISVTSKSMRSQSSGQEAGGSGASQEKDLEAVLVFASPEADGRIPPNDPSAAGDDGTAGGGGASVASGKAEEASKASSKKSKGGSKASAATAAPAAAAGAVSTSADLWSQLPPPNPKAKLRASLWADLLNLAWAKKAPTAVPLVLKASRALLEGPGKSVSTSSGANAGVGSELVASDPNAVSASAATTASPTFLPWSPRRYAPLVAQQVEAQYALAQSLAVLLAHVPDRELVPTNEVSDELQRAQVASSRRELGTALGGDGSDVNGSIGSSSSNPPVVVLSARVQRLKKGCLGALVGGLRRALRLATDNGDGSGLASGGDPDAMPIEPLDAPAPTPAAAAAPSTFTPGVPSGKTLNIKLSALLGPPLSLAAQAYRYLVENGAVLLWNLHLPLVVRGAFQEVSPELKSAWQLAERALRAVQSPDSQLYANIATALVEAHVAHGELAEAEKVCRRVQLLCRPLQAQRACKVRSAIAHLPSGGLALVPLPGAPANVLTELKAFAALSSGSAIATAAAGAAPEVPSEAPLRFVYDPTENPPVYDEAKAKQLFVHAHFTVVGVLEQLRARSAVLDAEEAAREAADEVTLAAASASGTDSAEQAEALSTARLEARRVAAEELAKPLEEVVELMAWDAAAAGSAYRQAAAVTAWHVHALAASKGGGSAGLFEAAGELHRLVGLSRSVLSQEEDVELLELRTELWSKLAAEALKLNKARLAQRCCRAALSAIVGVANHTNHDRNGGGAGASPALLSRVPPNVWRWRSVAERLWASAVAAMVSPLEQDKDTMDRLRCASMDHLLAAADCALSAGARHAVDLCVHAARDVWNTGLPLAGSPASRRALRPYVETVLRSLVKASSLGSGGGSSSSDGLLRVQLFALLCECLADVEKWADGLREVNNAFSHVPSKLARPLWQWRVVFLSRLGRSALDGLAKMKESDPLLQARVWSALGHASSDRRQQLLSHTKALELLEKEACPERAEFLVEFGEWCLSAGLPRRDAEIALDSALDVLFEMDQPFYSAAVNATADALEMEEVAQSQLAARDRLGGNDQHHDAGGGGGGAGHGGAGSDGSRFSPLGSARSQRSGASGPASSRGGAIATSRAGAASARSGSGGGGPGGGASRGSGGSSSRGRGIKSARGGGGGSSGGGSGDLLSLALGGARGGLDCTQLECAVRALTMRAAMAPTSTQRRSFLAAAAHYAERVVHGAIRAANLHRACLAFQKRLPAAIHPMETPEAPPDPKAKKGGKGAPAAAAAPPPVAPTADDSPPVESGHTPTHTLFDEPARAACAIKLGLADPKALTMGDFCHLVLKVLEQPPGLPSSDASPNEGDGKGNSGGSGSMVVGPPLDAAGLAAQEVARATAARLTAATLPGAPYFAYPATPSEWSVWTPPPPLVAALAALPDTLQVLAPSPATLPKLPITLHHLHALMQSLGEEGLHVQALPVSALGELASRTASLPPLPPLQTLWAVRAAKLRLQLGDNASASLCLANAPSLGLAEPEANLYFDEVALVEQQRAKSGASNKNPDSKSENTANKANVASSSNQSLLLSDGDGKGKSASKPWKVSNCPVRSAWAALAMECAATPELALFRPSREYASHTRRHAEAFGDHAAAAQCCLAEAGALEMEGLPKEAAQQVLTAQLLWRRSAPTGAAGTIRDWATSTLTLARLLVADGNAKEAERCLTDILMVLRKRLAAADLTASNQAGVVPGETVATAAWAVAAVSGHLANLHATAGIAALANSSGTSGGPRAEALRQWSSRAAQADAFWGEAHYILATQGASLEAALALAEQALGRRRLLVAEAQDRGDAPGLGVEGTARLASDVLPLLEQSCDEAMALHRSLAPPREGLLLSASSIGGSGGGTGSTTEKEAALSSAAALAAASTKTVDLWPTPVANAPPLEPALSLPLSRACGRLCLAVASCRLELAIACGEPASLRRQAMEYEARVTDTVARWIDATAPPTVKPTVALTPAHLEVALMRAQSAERLLASSGAQFPDASVLFATAGTGQALTLLAMRSGLLDDAWTEKTTNSTSIQEAQLPPRRGLIGLFANDALATSAEAEHLTAASGEAASSGDGESSNNLPLPPPRAVSLLRTMRVEERGDLAWQARQALEAGALQSAAVKDWAAVGPRAASLIELTGSRDPATGVAWLLLYQACVSRAWLAHLLTSAAAPTSRLGRHLRVLGTAGAGSNSGSSLLEGSSGQSDSYLGKPLSAKYGGVLGQPREQPLVQRTLAVLQGDRHASSLGSADGQVAPGGKAAPKGKGGGKGGAAATAGTDNTTDVSSAAWAMLDCTRPVPITLRALPASCCALVLQLSPNKDALYVALVARGSLDSQGSGGSDKWAGKGGLPSACRAPVLYRYELPRGAWRSIVNLKRNFKAWRSAVARFLTRFGDDLGVTGDAYPAGASATRAWQDGQPPKGDFVSEACRVAEDLEASAAEALHEAEAARVAAEQAAAAEAEANAATAPPVETEDSKKAKGKKGAQSSENKLASDAAALAEAAVAKTTASEAAVAAAANARRHADQATADLQASLEASWQLDSLEQQLLQLVSEMDALLGPCLGGNELTPPTATSSSPSFPPGSAAPKSGRKSAPGTAAESSRGATPQQEPQEQEPQRQQHPMRRALDALAACDPSACAADGLAPGLVLWADHQLLDFPLEALAPLRRRHLKLWARDFSAHVFANRYAAAEPAYAAASMKSGAVEGDGGALAPDGSAAVSVERSDVAAVVDPRSEDTGPSPAAVAAAARAAGVSLQLTTDQSNDVKQSADNPSASKAITTAAAAGPGARLSAVQVLRGPLTQEGGASKWRAGATVAGDERMVSSGEWQGLLTSSKHGGFLFYGPGQALAHLPPSCLAGLDARGCRMALVIDQMDNDASLRRKSKEDSSGGANQASVLALQQPLESAAMWSLTGVGSVVQNQWAASFHANAKLVQTLFKGLHGEGLQLGAAVAAATTAEVAPPRPPSVGGGNSEEAAGSGGVCYAKARAMYNPVVYGLPAVHFTGGK